MLLFFLKITKTGKEINRYIKGVMVKEAAHIMHKKVKLFIFKLPGKGNIGNRKIDAGNFKASFVKVHSVPSPAAGYIQQTRVRCKIKVSYQVVDEPLSFLRIALLIKDMIKRRVKPVLEPMLRHTVESGDQI